MRTVVKKAKKSCFEVILFESPLMFIVVGRHSGNFMFIVGRKSGNLEKWIEGVIRSL